MEPQSGIFSCHQFSCLPSDEQADLKRSNRVVEYWSFQSSNAPLLHHSDSPVFHRLSKESLTYPFRNRRQFETRHLVSCKEKSSSSVAHKVKRVSVSSSDCRKVFDAFLRSSIRTMPLAQSVIVLVVIWPREVMMRLSKPKPRSWESSPDARISKLKKQSFYV